MNMHVMNDSPWPRPFPGAIGTLTLAAILLALTAPAAGQCAVQRLGGPDPGEDDFFGFGLDTQGDVAMIGSYGADDHGEDLGAVYLYEFDGLEWVAQGLLLAPTGVELAQFGSAVDICGDLALVRGAIWEHDDWRAYGFVYRFDGTNWQEEAHLRVWSSHGAYAEDRTVAINDEFACIGYPITGSDPGRVFIYRYDPDSDEWISDGSIQADDGNDQDYFGMAVAFAGQGLLVGAPGHDVNGELSGAAYVFRRDPKQGEWLQEAKILPEGVDEKDWFGCSIATFGERAVITEVRADPEGPETGAAHVYRRQDGQWIEEAFLVPSDARHLDLFGISCAIENDQIVVGARGVDALEEDVGAVYVFRYDRGAWAEAGRFVNAAGERGDFLGDCVRIGGHGALASVLQADDPTEDCGAVYSVSLEGADCNRNNMCDWIDLGEAISEDCNNNEIPDECDAAIEFSAESGELSPIGHESPQTYRIIAPPPAFDGDVGLRLYASADLGDDGQYIELRINNHFFGTIFEQSAWPCSEPPDQEQIRIPQVLFNYMIDGGQDLVITMTASEAVDPYACNGESWIAVEVAYTAHGPGDANHNGIPDECECPADLDGDGDVDTADLLILLGAWGTPDGDVDFDGDTDTADLLALLAAWGECPE
jgi:hypothetical protein